MIASAMTKVIVAPSIINNFTPLWSINQIDYLYKHIAKFYDPNATGIHHRP